MVSTVEFLALIAISFLITYFSTPKIADYARKINFVDYPNSSHKSHVNAVPYLGGVAISIGIIFTIYLALYIDYERRYLIPTISTVLIPAIVLGIVGLIDDKINLSALARFIFQTTTALICALYLAKSNDLGNPTGIYWLDLLLMTSWIVGICNSINFFDNLDGSAAGVISIASSAIFVLTLISGQVLVAALSAVALGSCLAFLIWNKSPATIFMGDAGALFLGTLMAILTLKLNPETPHRYVSFAIPLLVMAIPILDTLVALLSRIRRKIPLIQGGRDHLSHRLKRAGLSDKQAAIVLWFLSVFFALSAIVITSYDSAVPQLLIIVSTVWIAIFVWFIKTPDS